MLEMRVFRADLKPKETEEYIKGHQKVLEAYGVTQITSADLGWTKEPYSYITIARDKDTKEILGGGRIQLAGSSNPLPIETAIDELDSRVYCFVKEKNLMGGTGEYCGLWNSKKIAGYGIGSRVLMRVGVAVMSQINISSLLAFVSPATINGGKKLGFQII
ncbi:MAG TPA: hypothetical protein VK084_11380, partial [Chitinophagaceae bacterium]|nr:hypothetical protein [Chitinophagaceae bacterium]